MRPHPCRLAIQITLLASISGCSLPPIDNRPPSVAVLSNRTLSTVLGKAIKPQVAAHPGKVGIKPLGNPRESFAIRALLVKAAERTLDVQYYIWQGDTTGMLLMDALHHAAQRGVRVRLLLDDNGTSGIDTELATLDLHDNIEVRLFNPFLNRQFKSLGFVYDFAHLNRRMHNKSLTADSQATIVGGRNIGDDYFGATSGILKSDLDVLLIGPVVDEVSMDFDRFWASESAYPLRHIVRAPEPSLKAQVIDKINNAEKTPEAHDYVEAIRESTYIEALLKGKSELLWANVTMVTDDPAKGSGPLEGDGLLIRQLDRILEKPERSVVLVSPYFVPGDAGTAAFAAMAERGIDVRVLTNALEATDVLPVQAGYAKRRKALLMAGVRLYEMKRLSSAMGTKRNASAGPFGSSASSLHAKTFAIDGARAFVGSFNFDPRSMQLNTELGFVIDSPSLAHDIAAAFDTEILANAYEVRIDRAGDLYWCTKRGDEIVRIESEPNSSLLKRVAVKVLSWLPIEWLL